MIYWNLVQTAYNLQYYKTSRCNHVSVHKKRNQVKSIILLNTHLQHVVSCYKADILRHYKKLGSHNATTQLPL